MFSSFIKLRKVQLPKLIFNLMKSNYNLNILGSVTVFYTDKNDTKHVIITVS